MALSKKVAWSALALLVLVVAAGVQAVVGWRPSSSARGRGR